MTETKILVRRAAWIDPAVVNEFERANMLAQKSFYTEASLRLGRTVETGLYAIGRELDLDVRNRVIKKLANLRQALISSEKNIIRKSKKNDEVRALSNISKQLSETIAYLIEDTHLCDGELDIEPQRNEQLFRQLIQEVEDLNQKRALQASEPLLRQIQEYRNQAAHASLEGIPREVQQEEYEKLLGDVAKFINLLASFILGYRAKKLWAESVPTPPENPPTAAEV